MTATRKKKATASSTRQPERGARRSVPVREAGTAQKPKTAAMKKSGARSKVSRGEASKKAGAKKEAATAVSGGRTVADAAQSWHPRIVVFACNWCSYAGADTAGVSRIQHKPNFRMIRVMCSGRIQPAFVLRAFEKGADGVLVSGCHFGDCHYIFGNERAVEQFTKTMNMVKMLGIEPGRLRLEWISAAEGVRFAQVINEFTDQVRDLGPSPFARPEKSTKLAAEREEVA